MEKTTYLAQKNFINVKLGKLAKSLLVSNPEAFAYLCLALVLDMDENNIDDDIIIDGEGDKQVDAISITQTGNKKIIDLVQIKKESGFSSNVVIQIENGLKWIFQKSPRDVNKLKNVKLKDKINEIREIWDANTVVNVYYCTLGDADRIPREAREQSDTLIAEYNKLFNDKFNFKFIGAQSLYDLIQQRERNDKVVSEKISYEFHQDAANMLDYYIKDFNGVICSVRGEEIARLVENNGDNLFEANIRKFLGDNKVNMAILDTCKSESNSQFFWFFNNGITIVCEDFKVLRNPKNPHIEVRNAQIVNGCQTATTLFNAWRNGELNEDTRVLVKIFSAKNESFVNKITEATNNQTAISTRDLRANDRVQILIENYLKEKYGYYYERKRNQYRDRKIGRNKIVNNEKVAQAFLAIGKKRPSVAKTSKARLFSEEFYEDVFSAPIEHLLISYKIVEFADQEKKQKEKDETKYSLKIYGFLHIARMIAFYLFGSEDFPPTLKIDEHIKKIEQKTKTLKALYKKSFDKLLKQIQIKQKRGELESLNNFFKTTDAETLVNNILHP